MSKTKTQQKNLMNDNTVEQQHPKYSSIYEEYFTLTKKYKEKYDISCVLLEVGSFFELYTYYNKKTGDLEHPHIKHISEICNLNLVEKKNMYENKHPVYMMGFRNYILEKYVEILIDNNYTVVVYTQEKDPTAPASSTTMRRVFNAIYSVGTYVGTQDTTSNPASIHNEIRLSNNIMCIWFEMIKQTTELICGVSTVGSLTGSSSFFEYTSKYSLNPTTFDELERAIDLYSPSEILLISPFDKNTINTITQYSRISTAKIHYYNTVAAATTAEKVDEEITNCQKQTYIKYILTHFFEEGIYEKCSEFNEYPIATQSFCFLLNFIKQHNPQLVQKISFPAITNSSFRVVLPNHTLMQLNIINDGNSTAATTESSLSLSFSTSASSVLSLLNKTSSLMGKRRFKTQLLNPVFDEEWLNREYNNTELLINQSANFLPEIRKTIQEIKDIEKITRQIILMKAQPSTIYNLFESVQYIFLVQEKIKHIKFATPTTPPTDICTICTNIMDFISSTLILENCKNCQSINSTDPENQFICPNISAELDELQTILTKNNSLFTAIKVTLNKLLDGKADSIKEHTTDKNNKKTLQLTKTRAANLKEQIAKFKKNKNDNNNSAKLPLQENSAEFDLDELKMHAITTGSSTYEIDHPLLSQIAAENSSVIEKINKIIATEYQNFLSSFIDVHIDNMRTLADFVGNIDVLQTKAFVAVKYNYCKPTIVGDASVAFFNAENIRHALIEHINTNEIYVTNNVALGGGNTTPAGILLYGVNAAGKTSLIRAIGICLILAQAGIYVPCSAFKYKPYRSIFSRILGNDNLFKGLSTFQVEMSELRVILLNADENSLVLGDELCSGSEIQSSLAIFAAGLQALHTKRANYIFATHFFEISDFDEITNLIADTADTADTATGGIKIKHLSVHYDKEKDTLIYDRKLKDGYGSRTYGLEVCKSLYMPPDFIANAYNIRNKYFGKLDNILRFKQSAYNPQKIRGICEKCNQKLSTETHHIREQKYADENGFIDDSFHKNHPGNLQALCNDCHKKMHF